jgi:hypothetical protein
MLAFRQDVRKWALVREYSAVDEFSGTLKAALNDLLNERIAERNRASAVAIPSPQSSGGASQDTFLDAEQPADAEARDQAGAAGGPQVVESVALDLVRVRAGHAAILSDPGRAQRVGRPS